MGGGQGSCSAEALYARLYEGSEGEEANLDESTSNLWPSVDSARLRGSPGRWTHPVPSQIHRIDLMERAVLTLEIYFADGMVGRHGRAEAEGNQVSRLALDIRRGRTRCL